jgi:hypothetical protein
MTLPKGIQPPMNADEKERESVKVKGQGLHR